MMSDNRTAPGRAFSEDLGIIEFFEMFPNDRGAEKWFEDIRWGLGGRKRRYKDLVGGRTA